MVPRGGGLVSLIGRQVGEEDVQDGASLDATLLELCTFSMITDRSFHWPGACAKERSTSRQIDQEMPCDRT